jgi:hypothetical protein
MTYQEILQAIDRLPAQERDSLLELVSQHKDKRGESEVSATTGYQAVGIDIARQDGSQDEDVIHSIDRDGNHCDYQIKDLIWNPDSYDYIKNQNCSFNLALPELIERYAGKYIIFEDGKVIDSDDNQDILLDRVCETDFYKHREAIYCVLVPERLKVNA